MNLYSWALRHNISAEAIDDLRVELGMDGSALTPPFADPQPTSEEGVSKRVRVKEASDGNILFRNNVGAMQGDNGRVIRYGLANDSKQMNAKFKSSDLIGITPVTVSQFMVGQVLGVFTAVECKKPGWKYTGTDHEQAQLKFIELVISKGGLGRFAS